MTAEELVYRNSFETLGPLQISTDDGTDGHRGYIPELVDRAMAEEPVENPVFLNCGPEPAPLPSTGATPPETLPPGPP